MRRRIHRVLVVAGFLAIVAGLWPAPAHAAIRCKVQQFFHCTAYACCLQICTICEDGAGNIIDVSCGDTICWSQYP